MDTSIGIVYFFERRYSACTGVTRVTSERVQNGVASYVNAFEQKIRTQTTVDIRLNTTIEKIIPRENRRFGGKVIVGDADGAELEFDHVILTNPSQMMYTLSPQTHADDHALLLKLVGLTRHADLLSSISTDTSLLGSHLQSPEDSCFYFDGYNILKRRGSENLLAINTGHRSQTECFSSHPIPFSIYAEDNAEVRETLKPNMTLQVNRFRHIFHDLGYLLFGRNLHKFQGEFGLWFAGGDCSVNLHEQALASGLVIAQQLGARLPFVDSDIEALNSFLAVKLLMLHGINTLFVPN